MKNTLMLFAIIYISMYNLGFAKSSVGKRINNIVGYSDSTQKTIEVGGRVPALNFSNIINTNVSNVKLNDYRGKLLILDFWATWCSPCVASISKNNALQAKYHDNMQIVMVSDQKKEILTSFFANYKKLVKVNLTIPSIYEDKILRGYFPHYTVPHYVWINRDGIVIAITDDAELTESNILKVLSLSTVSFNQKTERSLRTDVDPDEPFFMETISKPLFVHNGYFGKEKLEYKSMLFGNIDGLRSVAWFYTGRLTQNKASILSLYCSAYSYSFGKLESIYRNRILLETKDTTIMVEPKDRTKYSEWVKKNEYCYDLTFPDYYEGPGIADGSDSIRRYACLILKKELDNYFGYNSSLQKRKVKCLVLKVIDSNKINSNLDFGKSLAETGRLGAVFNDPNLSKLIEGLKFTLQKQAPLIDRTNYYGRVNIKIEAPLGNLQLVKKELNRFGLDLVEEENEIDMVVISD